jgi:hypothetical protein
VVAPLEPAGARLPEPSVERNSLSFHPTWPERSGELTWVVLEWRRYRNTALDDTAWALALDDGGGRLQGPEVVGDRSSGGGGGRRWRAGHRSNRGRLAAVGRWHDRHLYGLSSILCKNPARGCSIYRAFGVLDVRDRDSIL